MNFLHASHSHLKFVIHKSVSAFALYEGLIGLDLISKIGFHLVPWVTWVVCVTRKHALLQFFTKFVRLFSLPLEVIVVTVNH